MLNKGFCAICGEYGEFPPHDANKFRSFYSRSFRVNRICVMCIEKEQRAVLEEKLNTYRRAKILETLSSAVTLLNNGDFLGADRYGMAKELLHEYEKLKFKYIKTDLNGLENTLGKNQGYFDDEKAKVLSITGKDILVQARAGSGKTTAIALKVRQLIKYYGAKPNEILVLAFNKKAAQEFEKRINEYCGENVVDRSNTLTFHSLAYRLVNPGEQLLFNDSYDDSEFVRGQQSEFIGKIYDKILAEDRGTILTLLYNFFKALAREKMPADFGSEGDYYLYRKNLHYVSLGGERVKSKGEKFIADFLFEHKITKNNQEVQYAYEYNLKKQFNIKRPYNPDFLLYLKDEESKIDRPLAILEHWGVTNRHRAERDYMSEKEEQEYFEKISWAREICLKEIIPLIETSVDDFVGISELDERAHFERILGFNLEMHGFVLHKLTEREIIKKMLNARANLDQLFEQINQFISRAKKQSLTPSDIQSLAERNVALLGVRAKSFIKIVRRVYERYQNELVIEGKIDFDDLLMRAIQKIEQTHGNCEIDILGESRKISDIKYILIDEFQDVSMLFYQLIDAIRKSNPSVSFFCVGDDWQAINGFAGSDPNFLIKFEKYFEGARRSELLTNHRSYVNIVRHSNLLMAGRGAGGESRADMLSGEVYLSSLQYVEWRNTDESKEKCHEDEKYRVGAMSLEGWPNKKIEISRYLKTLDYIVRGNADKTICLLFRTNSIYGVKISNFTNIIKKWYSQNIICSTAHSYKGKESDVVIVVDANRGNYPKIHPDNELMELLGVTMSNILEEERRLFYVAITRAKEKLYLLYEDEVGHTDYISPEQWPYLSI